MIAARYSVPILHGANAIPSPQCDWPRAPHHQRESRAAASASHRSDESVAAITAHTVAMCTSPPTTSCGRRACATTGNILRIHALSLTATGTVKYAYSESSSPASTNLGTTGHPSQVRTRHYPAKQHAQQWPSQPGAELWYATANNIDHATVACTKRPPSTDNKNKRHHQHHAITTANPTAAASPPLPPDAESSFLASTNLNAPPPKQRNERTATDPAKSHAQLRPAHPGAELWLRVVMPWCRWQKCWLSCVVAGGVGVTGPVTATT
eukprot:CAMPEP_0182556326 /NCGR_PEP_ID=MMETSP1324-20130603/625_1 /TAXON_ID=236786 /ORGANISM="Florenciella sp., Strain RCC1587" /LENGTH=266 /DNA_ID=CAMNT_0024768197 /DNA_START=532 /DNA_END=1330 /DNA_ORIENTATION=+